MHVARTSLPTIAGPTRIASLRRRVTLAAALTTLVAACSGEPVGGDPVVVLHLEGSPDTAFTGTPGELLDRRIVLRAELTDGEPLIRAAVRWTAGGAGGAVLDATTLTDSAGRISASWRLGTVAAETQMLTVSVTAPGVVAAERRFTARAVPARVAAIDADSATVSIALARTAQLTATATDPYGNRFRPLELRIRTLDSTVAVIGAGGTIVPRRRGSASLVVDVPGTPEHADTVTLNVFQRVAAIRLPSDSVRFSAVGTTIPVAAELIDEDGLAIADSAPAAQVDDGAVATLATDGTLALTSRGQGETQLRLASGGVQRAMRVIVSQVVARVLLEADTVRSNALGDTISVSPVGVDSAGTPKLDARFSIEAVDTSVVTVIGDRNALVTRHNGLAAVQVRALSGASEVLWVAVQQEPAGVQADRDTVEFRALGAQLPAPVTILDRRGVSIEGATPTLRSEDTSVVNAEQGSLRAAGNGVTRVWAAAGGDSVSFVVRVRQRPTAFTGVPAEVSLSSLGESWTLAAVAVDSLGFPIAVEVGLELADSSVVTLGEDGRTLTAAGNGTTTVRLWVDGLQRDLAVRVQQRAARLEVTRTDSLRIVTGAAGASIALACRAFDANDHAIEGATVAVAATAEGPVSGAGCGSLTIARSGVDTLRLTFDGVTATLPVAVAIPPRVETAPGTPIVLDSLPGGAWAPWAPTLRRNSRGEAELYLALYPIDQYGNVTTRGSLHRFRTPDLRRFEYDGVALAPSNPECSLYGSGIENVNVVPRAEGGGWRMFFAGGSFECYGWQVFSAVSSDERTWEVEEGVRVSNLNPLEPRSPTGSGWPVGEGMEVDQLPDGTWRMLTGGYEPLDPREERFQIVEWRSPDQKNWTYRGASLTHRQLPDATMRFVYAPNVREIAPGLYRMLFAATGSTGRLYSAVSTDREQWQIEGELMPTSEYDMRYVTLLNDTIVFIRHGGGRWYEVVRATVQMP